MKKITFLLLMTLMAFIGKAETVLDLGSCGPMSDDVTYDTSSHQMTTTSGWTGIQLWIGDESQISGSKLVIKTSEACKLKVYVAYVNKGGEAEVSENVAATEHMLTLDNTKMIQKIQIQNQDAGTITFVSMILDPEEQTDTQSNETTVWTGDEAISWNTENYNGSQFDTSDKNKNVNFEGLGKGDIIRIYTTAESGKSPEYGLTYKTGDKWDWTDLTGFTTTNEGVITYTVASDEIATLIAERGLVIRGIYFHMTKITVEKASSSSTTDPDPQPATTDGDYTITINSPENGTVTADHTKANANETITLTVTPASDNYKLVSLRIEQVTDDEGTDTPVLSAPRRTPGFADVVTYTKVSDTQYTFIMPDNNVEITAVFSDNPVARPTITYDADNNKVTLRLTTAPEGDEAGYARNVKVYYTTDDTDPTTSNTRQESTTDVEITVTKNMTVIRAVGVSENGKTSVEVTQEVSLVRYLTVAKTWTVFCSPETFAVPDGLKAYTISAVSQPSDNDQAGSVTLKEQNVIAEGVPMVIENTNVSKTTKYKIENATGTIDADDMCAEFKGSATETSTLNNSQVNYVLKDGVFIRTTATKVNQYSCYLAFDTATSTPRFNLVVNEQLTGVNAILSTPGTGNGVLYDLQGRKVAQPTKKGLYILNGRKVVIK